MKEHDNEVHEAMAGEMRPEASMASTNEDTMKEAMWAEALAACHDGATAPVLARRYGITTAALYKRTRGDGKRARKRAQTMIDADAIGAGEDPKATLERAHAITTGTDKASRTRDALRASVSQTTMADVMLAIGQGLQQLATTVLKVAGAAHARISREGLPTQRRMFQPPIWEAARRDYEEGNFTAGEIAERYGMIKKTVETHASRKGWSKTVTVAPPPLLPPDDPAQVDETGKSNWHVMAHPAQRAPLGPWSTWLFQGGRGAGKTRAGAEWLAARAEATPNGIFAIVAATEQDLREVMIEVRRACARCTGASVRNTRARAAC